MAAGLWVPSPGINGCTASMAGNHPPGRLGPPSRQQATNSREGHSWDAAMGIWENVTRVRCEPAPSADGASMENITPPGTPAKRALAALDNPPPDVPAGPHKRISAKVRRAIDAMVSGDC